MDTNVEQLKAQGYAVTPFYDSINDCDWFAVSLRGEDLVASNDEDDAWAAADLHSQTGCTHL